MRAVKKLWLGWMGMGREMGMDGMGWAGTNIIHAQQGEDAREVVGFSYHGNGLLALGVERARLYSMIFGFPLFERMMRVYGYQG